MHHLPWVGASLGIQCWPDRQKQNKTGLEPSWSETEVSLKRLAQRLQAMPPAAHQGSRRELRSWPWPRPLEPGMVGGHMSLGQVMVWEQHRPRASVLRGQERTRRHEEGSGDAAPCPVSGRPRPTFQTQSCGPALNPRGSVGVLPEQPLCLSPSDTGAVPGLPKVGVGADWTPTPPPGPGDLPGRSPWRTSYTGRLCP